MVSKLPLPLRAETPLLWAESALADPEGLLSDHAHCEKKAAMTALSLLHAFPGKTRIPMLLARLAEEELNHFRRVLEALHGFGWALRPDLGNRYAQLLQNKIEGAKGEDQRLLDRLLMAALIEARSCERLYLLNQVAVSHPPLNQVPWLNFLLELERCEAGHALTYLNIAEEQFGDRVTPRLNHWLDWEAEIISSLPWRSVVH